MDLVEKLFIVWIILSTIILSLAIYNFVLGLRNRRDIDKLLNASSS